MKRGYLPSDLALVLTTLSLHTSLEPREDTMFWDQDRPDPIFEICLPS